MCSLHGEETSPKNAGSVESGSMCRNVWILQKALSHPECGFTFRDNCFGEHSREALTDRSGLRGTSDLPGEGRGDAELHGLAQLGLGAD